MLYGFHITCLYTLGYTTTQSDNGHGEGKQSRNGRFFIWASARENLYSGFLTKRDYSQSPQLQRLARKLTFRL